MAGTSLPDLFFFFYLAFRSTVMNEVRCLSMADESICGMSVK